MKLRLSDFWRWEGTIDRGPYAVIGVIGFTIKHNLDRFVAMLVFSRPWGLFNYWIPPTRAVRITSLPRADQVFLATMLAMALPFIWVGVVLTLRRLRAAGLPVWLVAFFFLPVVNLIFFALLSVLPSRLPGGFEALLSGGRVRAFLDRAIPEGQLESAALAVLLTVAFGAAATALGTLELAHYGWSLFVALPFCLGLGAVLLYGYHRPRSYGRCLIVSIISVLLLGLALLAVAVEGVICLAMAAPIALAIAAMGATIGYVIQRRPETMQPAPTMMLVLILAVPGLMEAEHAASPQPPLFAVRTAIEINAPPESVWHQVVSFAEIPPPEDPLFRLGIAYPTRATIDGRGVGAVRHCVFSTGVFVEPIEVWDEPRRLKFWVAANPAPMQEWTPYAEIHPPHLKGFLISRQGQFLLTPLAGGRTLLEGTTWYEHNMWPALYWQLWSDTVIHHIHLRVLRHIKRQAERFH
jgi:hypothetical protein